MKVLIALFFFLFKSFIHAQDYSVLYEEDYEGIMIVYYYEDDTYAEIISFGGYEWFEKTYSILSNPVIATYIQPSSIRKSDNMESFMREKYKIRQFRYLYNETLMDQKLSFSSLDGITRIIGYITRGESFSIASLNEESWFAGIFTPIKNKRDLIFLANKNQMTFCKLLKITKELPGKNIDLKSSDLVSLMSRENYSCNKNNLLN